MGYVRSRKFCCCLPVRFGVFCMAILGLVGGGIFGIAGFVEIHKLYSGQLELESDQKTALWIVSLTYSWMALVSLIGLIGSIGKLRSFIGFYAYTVTINTLVIMAAGIYLVWTLFHKREDSDVNKCVAGANGDVGDVKHWVCQKGFDVIRILVVVFFVIIWIFQLVGIFIVFDYVGQLREEATLEDEESRKSQPAWSVTAPTPSGPAMRTTYDAAPYDPPMQGGWQSAKSPYAFTGPSAQGQGR